MISLVAAEWIKIRSVRSTAWTIGLTIALSAGLAYLIGTGNRSGADPLAASLYSLTLGQLALVVLAVFVVTSEHSTGTLSASLAAVPRRGEFFTAKVLAGSLLAAAVALVTVPATFTAAQAGLGPHRLSPGADGVPTALVGAVLYLVLIYLFAAGVATLLRGPVPALGTLLPLLFLGAQGLGNVPVIKAVTQFLPDQAGMVIMHIAGRGDDPRFLRPYGPWTGLGITALWAAAALLAGYLALRRRDV